MPQHSPTFFIRTQIRQPYLESTKPLPPITAKVSPLATYSAIHPITSCTTVISCKLKLCSKAFSFVCMHIVNNNMGRERERETCDTTSSVFPLHHHEPVHILEDKFCNAFLVYSLHPNYQKYNLSPPKVFQNPCKLQQVIEI